MTTWDSLSDLCSLQCRIRTEQSIILQRRQKEILKWLSNLSDDQLALCLALDITPILKEVSAILQFLLISEPHSLEQVCLFQWAIVKGGVHIERSKSGKISQDTESLRSDQIDILNQIRVVWEGTNLIDLRFSNKQILKLMLRVSQGQCLTRLPDQEGPYGLMWLRIKTRFSLAELFVALLEIRIWKFWKKGICHELSSTAETKRKLLLEMVKSVPNIHLTIEKAGADVLSTLVVDNSLKNKSVSGAEVIPLYLQIMKQRLLRCWYDPLLDTTPYRVPFKNLWILSHLISIPHHFKFHEGSNVSLLSPLIESIVSIPLLHSFTFYHEYKMRVREKLLSDYASSTLLIAEINSVPQKKNDKSKKKKKKTRKSKVSLPMKSVSPKSRTPSPLFVCLTTDEVTPNLIHSTTAFSHCVSILNSIIDNALEFIQVVDASTDVKVKFTDSDDNVVSEYSDTFEESSLSSVLHVKGNIQVPWMFEEWGLPIFPEGLPQNNQQQEGTLYFDDTEESTMSWIRNHLPHGIFDGAYEVSEVISDCREPQIPKFVYSENKSLKYECSSLPTSPKTNDNASPTLNHIGGRNERAWSFTEALRSADKVDTLSPRVGRRRADSLDPSHHHTPPRIVSLEPQIGVSTLPSTSSLVDSDQCHFMRFPKIEANFLSQDPSQEINTDEDNSFDDTFHDNDSRLSFGIWSQEVEPDISDTSKCKVPPDLVALSCSLLRSHADTIALRNIIALQQSFIIQPQNQFMLAPITTSNGLYIPLSYYPGNSLAGYGNIDFRGHQARELDVMSDSGDPQFAKRVGKIALGGAATMSSLYIQNKRSAVDDAGYGMASHKQSQFSSPAASIRTSFSSRSLSNQFPMKKLDPDDSKLGLKVKDDNDYFDGLVNNPNSTRNEGHPLGPPFNFSDKTQLTRMRNNSDSNTTPTGLWTVAEDYPLMKRDYKKKAFGLFKDELIPSPHLEQQQHRIRKQDGRHNDIERDLHCSPSPISSPNLHLDSISTSKYLESDNPIINPPTLPPKVRTTPTKPYSSPSLYLSPLCTMTEYQGGIPSLLTKEILTFVSKIDNFDATWRSFKTSAIERMRFVVKSLWPRAQVKPFGSFVSGLSLPSSDLDLVICLPKVHREAGPEAAGFLEGRNAIKESWQQNLARCLRAQTWVDVTSIKVITNTAVPVIKLKTRPMSGCVVSLDVSFEGNIHQGLEANRLNVALMNEFPSLRPLVLVLKQFLSRRGLCESFTGGLSSYALLLLCARFLQEQPSLSPLDVGGALLGLLNFYGNHLQPAVTGISVARRMYFSRSDLAPIITNSARTPLAHNIPVAAGVASLHRRHSFTPQNHSPHTVDSFSSSFKPYKFDPLFIEDPLAYENNVGRNCFRIHQVQKLWSETHAELLQRIFAIERGKTSKEGLLDILIGSENL